MSLSSREIIRKLEQAGWLLHSTKGSHHHFKHPARPGRVTVPHPKRELPRGTVASIFRQAGIKAEKER